MVLSRIVRHLAPSSRERGKTLRTFAKSIGFVYFGTMDQHADDYDAIRGFTASLSHVDKHYIVGTYDDYNIRLVDRSDTYKAPQNRSRHQTWTIVEVELRARDIPHVFFVPTRQAGSHYEKLHTVQPHLQPLNAHIANRSPEFHGRYQILARTTYSHKIDALFPSPLIVGIGARFWPCGIEIHNGKLFVYLSDGKVSKQHLETTLASSLWLAKAIDELDEL
jgi:hypothetical protein